MPIFGICPTDTLDAEGEIATEPSDEELAGRLGLQDRVMTRYHCDYAKNPGVTMSQLSSSRQRAGHAFILTCALMGAILVGCAPAATVTRPAPTATTAPAPTVTPPVATATPVRAPTAPAVSPTVAPGQLPALQPAGAATGIADLDAVIKAVLGNSLDAKRKLVRYVTTPCTTAQGAGGPPKCAAGEANNTPVEVFPFVAAEGEFVRHDAIDRVLQFTVEGLYGVYRVPDSAFRAAYWPAGQYAAVFVEKGVKGQQVTEVVQTIVYVEGSAIVRLRRTPFAEPWPPQEAVGAQWVLPPVR